MDTLWKNNKYLFLNLKQFFENNGFKCTKIAWNYFHIVLSCIKYRIANFTESHFNQRFEMTWINNKKHNIILHFKEKKASRSLIFCYNFE